MARLVVIGEGVAATAFLFALTQKANVDKFSSIIQIAHDDLAPATSLRSTAIAALRGTRPGLSPLGDEIVEMWSYTHPLFSKQKWNGLKETEVHSWVYSDKAERRYGHLEKISASHFDAKKTPRYITTEPGWIIEPATFLPSVPQPKVEKLKTVMTSLERVGEMWQVGITGGIKIEADVVVMATGPWSEWTRELFVGSPLEGMKSTQGSFFQWDNADFGAKNFVIGLEGMVCVYHADLQRLILGATSVSGDATFIPHMNELNEIRDEFFAHVNINFPFHNPQIITGLRAQTKGRRPWTGPIGTNLYAVGGLYKTGWVTAWPLGDRLAAML